MDPTNPRVLYAAIWQVQRTPWACRAAGAAVAVEERGWRRHLVEAHRRHRGARIAQRTARQDRGERVRIATRSRVRADRSRRRRTVPSARTPAGRGRASATTAAAPARLVLHHISRRPAGRRTSSTSCNVRLPALEGRRQNVPRDARAARRQPRPLDRSGRPRAHDRRQRRRRHDLSCDGGGTWSNLDNQPTAQFYHVITDDQFPYRVYGSQQDNSTVEHPEPHHGYGIETERLVGRGRRRERLYRARSPASRRWSTRALTTAT